MTTFYRRKVGLVWAVGLWVVLTASSAFAARVVTLAPSLAELVAFAGAQNQLVGVSQFSDYPAGVAALPKVADAFNINVEAVLRLHPDWVLAWKSGNSPRQVAKLQALGLRVVWVDIAQPEDIPVVTRRLGQWFGTSVVAEQAAAHWQQQWRALQVAPGPKPPKVFIELWDKPLLTVNGQHWMSAAVQHCGGVNVFASAAMLTPTVSREAALLTQPEWVIRAGKAQSSSHPWLGGVSLAQGSAPQILVLDSDTWSRPGPRVLQATATLCARLRSQH